MCVRGPTETANENKRARCDNNMQANIELSLWLACGGCFVALSVQDIFLFLAVKFSWL